MPRRSCSTYRIAVLGVHVPRLPGTVQSRGVGSGSETDGGLWVRVTINKQGQGISGDVSKLSLSFHPERLSSITLFPSTVQREIAVPDIFWQRADPRVCSLIQPILECNIAVVPCQPFSPFPVERLVRVCGNRRHDHTVGFNHHPGCCR